MSLVSSGTSTGRAEVEDRRRSSDWVATIFGIGARAAECSVSVMRNVLKCCESRESETIQHTLFECSAFAKKRDTFLERLYEVHPIARGLSPEGHCDFLMSDVLPRETENTVYGYLTALSKLRLGILTERPGQGEGS